MSPPPMSGRVAVVHEALGPVVRATRSTPGPLNVAHRTYGEPVTPDHRPTFSDMKTRLSQLHERLNQIMTDYMKANSSDDADPWIDSAFTQIYKLGRISSAEKMRLARKNAEKIRQKTLRAGSISTDDAVEPAMRTLDSAAHQSDVFYYEYCGPVAATAEDLVWNTAFRLDPQNAVGFKSDEWKATASEFRIRDSRKYELVPKKIAACYSTLEEYTDRNDRPRYMHPEELRTVGPTLPQSAVEHAFEHLGEFPGVTAPDGDKPAWEAIEEATVGEEATTDTESHA